MIIRFMSYLKGYVHICAKGYFLERFLNLCLKEDILLWDLERTSSEELSAKISISAFKNLKVAARKTRTKISIKQKYGFPFFLHRNKARRGIAFGIIIFALIIWYLSTHLMGITIEGTSLPHQKIYSALNSYGIKIGTPVKNINNKILKNQLMTSIEDFGWVGVNIKGSRLYIEATDRKKRKDALSSSEPCNIVAAKDGVVRFMEIRDGQTMVLINTPVKKGDLLVSGVIDSNAVGMRYTHSYGEVYATTWYKEEMKIPLSYTQKIMTGNTKSKYNLKLLNLSLNLYLNGKSPYKEYQSYKSQKEYSLPLKIFPSVFINKQEYFEQNVQTKKRTVTEAIELGKFYLCHKINTKLSKGAVIEDLKVSHKVLGDLVLVMVECECTEDIALKTPIDKTEDLEYNSEHTDETQMR